MRKVLSKPPQDLLCLDACRVLSGCASRYDSENIFLLEKQFVLRHSHQLLELEKKLKETFPKGHPPKAPCVYRVIATHVAVSSYFYEFPFKRFFSSALPPKYPGSDYVISREVVEVYNQARSLNFQHRDWMQLNMWVNSPSASLTQRPSVPADRDALRMSAILSSMAS